MIWPDFEWKRVSSAAMFIPELFNALLLPEIILTKYARTEIQQFVRVLLAKKKKKRKILNRCNICARNGVIEYESRNVSDLAISFLNKLLDQVKGRAVCLRSDNTNKERNFVICHCRRRMTLVTVSRFFSWVQWIYDSSVSQSLPLETMKFMAVWTICLRHKG